MGGGVGVKRLGFKDARIDVHMKELGTGGAASANAFAIRVTWT